MNSFQSFVLGLVQGITEFLPISSTAHLVLIPWFFAWHNQGLAHDVALHMGTLAAILYYFRTDWVMVGKGLLDGIRGAGFEGNGNGRVALHLIVATVPGALAGYYFEDQAATILRNPLVIAFTVALFGVVLYIADRYSRKTKTLHEIGLFDSITIGFFQALAIVPGVSRSGITITGALLRNCKRDEAARFSFLLSAPIIAGAGVFEARHLSLSEVLTSEFATGIAASAFFGFLSIKYLIRYVRSRNYAVFAIYRLLLAALIVYIYMIKAES